MKPPSTWPAPERPPLPSPRRLTRHRPENDMSRTFWAKDGQSNESPSKIQVQIMSAVRLSVPHLFSCTKKSHIPRSWPELQQDLWDLPPTLPGSTYAHFDGQAFGRGPSEHVGDKLDALRLKVVWYCVFYPPRTHIFVSDEYPLQVSSACHIKNSFMALRVCRFV